MSHNSFSYKIKIILSFQAPKFATPSSLSSTLKPVVMTLFLLKITNSKIFPMKWLLSLFSVCWNFCLSSTQLWYHVNFSKSQPNFSLADFSVKFKCQTQFQHCFSICYSLVFQHILSGVSAYDSALCFSIYYSLVFQHILTTVFQHMTQLCVSTYTTTLCFSIFSQQCFSWD